MILIDVRRADEHQLTRIEGAELIPMDTIPRHLERLEEMAESGPLIVFCHHGVRSANVVNWLRGQGIEGPKAWREASNGGAPEVDPSVPRY